MGKVKQFIIAVVMLSGGGSNAYAQDIKLSDLYDLMPWMKLIDETAPVTFDIITHLPLTTDFATNAAILEVMGLQSAIENRTNELTDSLVRIQTRSGVMTASIYGIQKNYEQAVTNTSDFEEGSQFYDYVMETIGGVIREGNELDRLIRQSKLPQKQECVTEITRLKETARGLVDSYIEIVTNGKASGAGETSSTVTSNDGYNAMSRLERLDAVREIAGQLKQMENMLRYLSSALVACENNSVNQNGTKSRKIDFSTVGNR